MLMTLLVLCLLLFGVVMALREAYWGPVTYYLLGILAPQFIWPWAFTFGRESMIAATVCLVAFLLHCGRGEFRAQFVKTSMNGWMFVLLLGLTISCFFGTYTDVPGPRLAPPLDQLIKILKVYFVFFVAVAVVDSERKILMVAGTFLLSAIYLVFWANFQYLDGNPHVMSAGRLHGPFDPRTGGSIYSDQNMFGAFFVVALPFVIYGAIAIRSRFLSWGLFAIVPLGWHAVFLTGSRGAMVGLLATFGVMLLFSRKKWLALLLIPAFVFTYFWQGGSMMQSRTQSIVSYDADTSSLGRLDAWSAAVNMAADNPVTGVGLSSFQVAMPFYSDKTPRDAHSIPFLYMSESGFFTLFAYVMVLWLAWRNALRVRLLARTCPERVSRLMGLVNEATICSLVGFTVCGLLISNRFSEMQFALLVINNAVSVIVLSQSDPKSGRVMSL